MLSKIGCVISDSDSENIQDARAQRDIEPLITEFNAILENMLKTNGINVQVALTNTAERLKTEMQSSQSYHEDMAKWLATENIIPTVVLQHRILADVYRSLADCV
jgi:hypothetical protein